MTFFGAYLVPISTGDAPDLARVGGKGANLMRLAQAGFEVPGGFILTTQAYRDFVRANRLDEVVFMRLPSGEADLEALEAISTEIRAAFARGDLPGELQRELEAAYTALGAPPVAVRSSATAEDLPELSFAGQQDTYLNVQGLDALCRAVTGCWSSLWTARAIGYRTRNHVPHESVELAVVVQRMVESEASGVLFTANPLSGLRSESVIDAALGLGEAVVSGQVEPDQYIVDTAQGLIRSKTLGAKALSVRSAAGGGTQVRTEDAAGRQALSDERILELAGLGRRVAEGYGAPQDIEWAWADGRLHLLQVRPITSLFPTPAGLPAEPLKVMTSFGALQGMLDAITPIGQDTMKWVMTAGARLFGYDLQPENQTVLFVAGERLWGNVTALLRNSVGRRIFQFVLRYVDPGSRDAFASIIDDPRLQPERSGIRLQTRLRLARFFAPVAWNVLRNLASPHKRRTQIVDHGERILEQVGARLTALSGDRYARLMQIADIFPDFLVRHFAVTFRLFVSGVAAGMASFARLGGLADSLPSESAAPALRWDDRVLDMTRGLAHNPTTEMDLMLWQTAQAICADEDARRAVEDADPRELAQRYRQGALPVAAQQAVGAFLARYGARGLAEIDLGRERWNEDPTHIFSALSGYLTITDPAHAPDVVFERSAKAAERAVDELVAALQRLPGGWFKSRMARFWAGRMRAMMALRESPKFFIVRILGRVRGALLTVGAEFVAAGELRQADDLVFLSFAEIRALAGREARDWAGLIAARRAAYQRERLRRQIPRLLLSDGRAFYDGLTPGAADGSAIHGSPVSPGSAEGRVCVVLDPRHAGLQPGDILVCPGTDPSWTPLFLTAAGLVMEVGGMMTHGAVVAREYGIPAIVGVDRATRRLHSGQRIRINGSTGEIVLLDDEPPSE